MTSSRLGSTCAAVALLMFTLASGCSCRSKPVGGGAAGSVAPGSADAKVKGPAGPSADPTAPEGPRANAAGAREAAAKDVPAKVRAKELASGCDAWLAALKGGAPTRAALDAQPAVRGILSSYLTCRAILDDAPATCGLIDSPEDQRWCRGDHAMLHALKKNRFGKAWLFTEEDLASCPPQDAAECQAWRAVATSGHVAKCPAGERNWFCRAFFTLDEKLAPPDGMSDREIAEVRREIRSKAVYAQGFSVVALQGEPQERRHAMAVLGDRKACEDLEARMRVACVAGVVPAP